MAAPSFLEALRQSAAPSSGVVKASSENGKATARNYAVVDTNAIIKGMRLEQLGTEAVIDEVRDSQSRHVLDTLPFGITIRDVDEEAYAAVKRFARQTGDITVLSSVDMKVIALAYMLEKAAHGMDNLRDKPKRPTVHKKGAKTGMKLPGWDFVPNPSDWDALEKEDEEAAARLEAAIKLGQKPPEEPQYTSSRIISGVQQLDISGGAAQHMGGREAASLAAAPAASAGAGMAAPAQRGGEASAARSGAPASQAEPHAEEEEEGAEGEEGEGDGGWERACSRNARVRKLKKETRKAAWEARRAQEEAEAAARAAEEEKGEEEREEEEEEEECDEEGDVAWDEPEDAGSKSSVMLVTADFAMQNTALQMGLRLVAPDGMRITRLQRWVLRCHACTAVSRQLERHFCDRCGNATMDRVVLTVDGEGVEHVGVRRRHRLRGTRYSLPNPKGGRYAINPILREDQLAMKRAPSKGNRRGPQDDDDGVFAVEFNEDKLFERSGNAPPLTNAGKAPIVGRMRNPNERKNKMLNRRR